MKKRLVPYLFIAPYLVLTAVFTLYPLANAAVLAFYQTNGPASRTFVGIDNFRFLLADPAFHKALTNTTVFTFAAVVLVLPLAMGLAVLLHGRKGRARGFLRLLLFSPNLVGGIFVGASDAVPNGRLYLATDVGVFEQGGGDLNDWQSHYGTGGSAAASGGGGDDVLIGGLTGFEPLPGQFTEFDLV